jgi:DNA-binding NarL/FixJ family response regulator
MKPLRILIADDFEVIRYGVRTLLTEHPGWEICAEASDGRQAVALAAELQPDVVVLDLGMPNLNGWEAARQILERNPETIILVLTMDESEQSVREALRAGVRGIILKSDAARDLVLAIEAVLNHRTFFTADVAEMLLNDYVGREQPKSVGHVANPLTPREREVVQLLAEGNSTRQVATVLGLSAKTAETHRANVMRKLNIHSVSQLVLYAVRNNLVRVATGRPAASVPESRA